MRPPSLPPFPPPGVPRPRPAAPQVYATHDFDAQGDSEMSMRGGESFLVQMSHLEDESGWIYAVAIDDIMDPGGDEENVARGGYVPISYLSDARFG